MHDHPPDTRASLIVRLRDADDRAAWDEFTTLYRPAVLRVARRRGLQAADAENLCQEVLLVVTQSVEKWLQRSDRGSFRSWLLRITHNQAVDMLTQRATRALGIDGQGGERALDAIQVRGEISLLIQQEYESELFRWAADRVRQDVSVTTWNAFWMTEIDGLSVRQAAQQLSVSVGNIYVGRSRVMRRIKSLVQERESLQ